MAKDIVVIGGGIGGLTAGMFASRLGLDTVLLEQLMPMSSLQFSIISFVN